MLRQLLRPNPSHHHRLDRLQLRKLNSISSHLPLLSLTSSCSNPGCNDYLSLALLASSKLISTWW
jgi:hypothetical protein